MLKDSLKELLDELGTLENFRTMTDEEVLNKAQDQARREVLKRVENIKEWDLQKHSDDYFKGWNHCRDLVISDVNALLQREDKE